MFIAWSMVISPSTHCLVISSEAADAGRHDSMHGASHDIRNPLSRLATFLRIVHAISS
jgi:hypothetical protein